MHETKNEKEQPFGNKVSNFKAHSFQTFETKRTKNK